MTEFAADTDDIVAVDDEITEEVEEQFTPVHQELLKSLSSIQFS